MTIISEADFRKQMKQGLSGGYLFFGDEDYLKQFDLDAARRQIAPEEAFAFFNDLRLDALDFTADKLIDALMPLPMGADAKIVSVTGLTPDTMKPTELDALCAALGMIRDYDYNVVIVSVPAGAMNVGYLPKRPSATLTKLAEHLTPVQFDRSTPARLAAWCGKHFEHNGVTASPELCRLLIDLAGQDMFVLAHEVDKISYYVLAENRRDVTEADIRTVAIASSEYDAFAFANALLESRYEDALAVLSTMKQRRVEPILALSEIPRVFCDLYTVSSLSASGKTDAEIHKQTKMHEYKVGLYRKSARASGKERLLRAIALATEADAILKGSPSDGYAAIERLICAL